MMRRVFSSPVQAIRLEFSTQEERDAMGAEVNVVLVGQNEYAHQMWHFTTDDGRFVLEIWAPPTIMNKISFLREEL